MRFLLLLSLAALAQPRKVALTIDDLPRGGDNRDANSIEAVRAMTKKLVGHLKGTGAIGFVNPGRLPALGEKGLQEVLKIWVDGGLDLGNHTFSHPDISNVTTAEYCADIAKAGPAIQRALHGRKPVYFRHPFLRTGKTKEAKEGHEKCLREQGYEIAPVTLDNSDWMFAAVYGRGDDAMKVKVKREYLDYMERIFAFYEDRAIDVFGRERGDGVGKIRLGRFEEGGLDEIELAFGLHGSRYALDRFIRFGDARAVGENDQSGHATDASMLGGSVARR